MGRVGSIRGLDQVQLRRGVHAIHDRDHGIDLVLFEEHNQSIWRGIVGCQDAHPEFCFQLWIGLVRGS